MGKVFQFKEFTIAQDQCAMKIGTDGVLLGAWLPLKNENSILDIGTGTGLIALMLAQRSGAETIDAIEIDAKAFEQAVVNFENSHWKDLLFCYHASFQEFYEEITDLYELIVSNPPFYTSKYKSENTERNKARFEESLPFENLFEGVSKLLKKNGKFAMIAPYQEENKLIETAFAHQLQIQKVCRVRGNEKAPIKRSLLLFGFENKKVVYESLVLETQRHVYTEEYGALVKDFYL